MNGLLLGKKSYLPQQKWMGEGKKEMRNKVAFEWQTKEKIWNAEDSRDISSEERIGIIWNIEEKFEE